MQAFSTAVRSLSFILLCLFTAGVSAQSPSQRLSSVLNTDGSVNTNITGSFDPTGYRMTTGPSGEPRFVAAQEPAAAGGCIPDSWDTSFTPNGFNGDVNTIVSDGLGNLYFGGDFTLVQGIPISGLAKWNGSVWSGFGTELPGGVRAIAIDGTDIYVGGSFNFNVAGGGVAKGVAKWNGTSWSALGAGLGGGTHVVEAIAIYGGAVYIGGSFNIADGSPANGLVRWDGAAYSGTGISGQVYSLTVSGGNLYVGGFMGVIADMTLGGLLKWDGVSWSGFGLTASTTTVTAIGFNGADIYVGGTIRGPGLSSHIARWNGTAWTGLGTFSPAPFVHAIAVVGANVYAGGTFERFNGTLSDGIVKYNGSVWSEVGTGTQFGSAEVYAFFVSGNTLYMGGDFQLAGGVAARNVATLTNGTTWAAPFPGTGLDGSANAIAPSGTDVYLGGSFIGAGSATANRIARWDGASTFSALGIGLSGFNTENSSISAVAVAGGKVYAGGRFSTMGGIAANGIAVWNGTAWAALGTGVTGGNGWVTVIVPHGDEIIVGGDFATAGGVAASKIAKWNGTAWSGFPGNPIPNVVTAIAFLGNDMYVGSATTTVDNPNYLLRFDGTTWTGIAPGMGGHSISSLAVIGSDLYASGGFQAIAGVPAVRVAKWNGSVWSALGGGLPQPQGQPGIVLLAASGPNLIAVGDFTLAGGGPADRAARWNGSAWSPLGNGLKGGTPGSIASAGGDIFVGGAFTTAGCNQSPYLARWRETVWTGAASADWHNTANWGGGSVPPPNAGMTISANNATISSADVSVSSLIVTGGRTLAIGAGRTLTVNGRIDLSNGFLTGPGNLIVNGDITLSNADVTNLGAITINGNLYLNGGKITGSAPVSLTTCRATALSGGSSTSFITSPLTRCIGTAGTYVFPVGTGTVYAPIELSNITGTGNFTVESKAGSYPGAAGLPANRLQRWWDFTNGGITQANLVFNYSDAEVVGLENRYRAYRINGGVATQLPTTLNLTANRATVTGVTSFSPWTLAEGTPVPLTLSGRVTNVSANGRGVAHALMSLDDGQGNIRYVMTNHFGYYRFVNVPTFNQYTVRVISKKYTFAAPTRVVDFDEFTTGINFISSDN